MNAALRRAAGVLLLALGGTGALADDARTQAEQRVRLAAKMIADSPAAQRIQVSGNSAAISHLDEGRLMLSTAEEALKANDFARARKAADDAIGHLGMARRLVPDVPARQLALRVRHEQQLASAERLVETWHERAGQNADAGVLDASSLVQQARALGESQRYEESLQVLAGVEQRLLAGIGRVLGAREIDYTLRPADAAEAYRVEAARHAALSELVPVALRELPPRPEARALIDRYVATAKSLQLQSQRQHAAADINGALAALRSASLEIERALAAAGVQSPPPTDSIGSKP
jgi:hypothetical protein